MTLLQIALNEINSKDSYESIKLILNHKDFPHKEKIRFAFDCAKDLDKHYDLKKYPEVKKIRDKCLELIADWLLGKSIDKKELDAAARAAYVAANAADAAGNAAYATAKAVNAAAYAVNAANAAANAAYAAAKAAYATYYAAGYAANAAAYAAKAKELHLYLCELIIKKYKLANIESFRLLYN